MSPGEVVKIRVLPREIQACAAIVRAVAPTVQNLSLAQVVRIGLSTLVESAIKAGAIKEPDPFDYERDTSPYRRGSLARKVVTSQVMLSAQKQRASTDMPIALFGALPTPAKDAPLTQEEITATRERTLALIEQDDPRTAAKLRRELAGAKASAVHKRIDPRKLRYDELKFRSEQDPANVSREEFKEMRRLQRELA